MTASMQDAYERFAEGASLIKSSQVLNPRRGVARERAHLQNQRARAETFEIKASWRQFFLAAAAPCLALPGSIARPAMAA